MKKFNWNFLLCVVFCTFCLTACDNDDDEGSAGQIGVLDHNSNVRISSLSYGYKNKNFYYSYGDDDKLKSII